LVTLKVQNDDETCVHVQTVEHYNSNDQQLLEYTVLCESEREVGI